MGAGEAVGDAVFDWCREQLGITVNETFGPTEINYIVGNCDLHWPARAGSMGQACPGHCVAVLDEDGHEVPRGVPGDVAVHRRDIHGHPDPVFFLGYLADDDDGQGAAPLVAARGTKSARGVPSEALFFIRVSSTKG